MATKTFDELNQLAIQIRDEKTNKQNTATRIGTQMLEHLEKLEQDYYDKTTINNRTSEYNVSINHPTSGISGGNKYDLASAIGQVPAELRTAGVKVSFLNESGNVESWEFSGGSWAVGGFSQVGAGKLTELGYSSNSFSVTQISSGNTIKVPFKIKKGALYRVKINTENTDYIGQVYTKTYSESGVSLGNVTKESPELLFIANEDWDSVSVYVPDYIPSSTFSITVQYYDIARFEKIEQNIVDIGGYTINLTHYCPVKVDK